MGPLTALLLASACAVGLRGKPTSTGVDHGLNCVSDYFSINCSLSIPPTHDLLDNTSYLLLFQQSLLDFEKDVYKCMLSPINDYYFCSFDKRSPDDYDQMRESFWDTDIFEISLCNSRDDDPKNCTVLDEEYMPAKNIIPLRPCDLTVNHTSSRYHFNWKSCYEDYLPNYILIDALMYQLRFYKKDHEENVTTLHAKQTSLSLDDDNFEPDSEYAARVQSSPDQRFYSGQWSEWSSEIFWKTDPPIIPVSPLLDKRVTFLMCVLVPLLLLLCYTPVVKLRKNILIPTPAPYFQSLYSDCHGDFKTWVVTPNTNMDFLKTEETLRIDTLTKSTEVQEEDGALHSLPWSTEEDLPGGLSQQAPHASLLGLSYTVTPVPPPTKTLSFSSDSETVMEGDSGCWLYGDTSLDAHWYSNEYCILSDTPNVLQRSGLVKAEAYCSENTFDKVTSNRDYQNEDLQANAISAMSPYT
ncbi:interleukin-9 receptor [Lampris incognitus]|uniref:interleukin-9 receptor n=1 Tax=Lampris incognitus TaxID=2546036 RepID=UPI0024B4AB34|nr:interleukin-9 receptor [Lampris incognitus]